MAEIRSHPEPARRRIGAGPLWSGGALALAALVVLPVIAVVVIALGPSGAVLPHLMQTTLPRYLFNTALLMVGVGALAAGIGSGAAWLVVMYRFPGRRAFEWLLFLPMAVPGYLGAYALVDFLEYAGPVQTGLRGLFGWETARDYWFPEIRSRGAAILVLGFALYPYVYLLARAAFREQAGSTLEVARALGAGPFRRFFRVALPMARPAIAAGVAIAMMETVSDFGTVEFFAVQTLTTGIFTVWLQMDSAAGAAQIALIALFVILGLVAVEKQSRKRLRYFGISRRERPVEPEYLATGPGVVAAMVCSVPVLFGFALPVTVLGSHAIHDASLWSDPRMLGALLNTLRVGAIAAVVTVSAAVLMVYGVRLSSGRLPGAVLPVTTIGYATPGAVLGIGLLIPLARFDNWLADGVLGLTGYDPGLLITGTAVALIYAYAVRFFALAQGAVDAAFSRISPSLPMAARALGQGPGGTLRRIYTPMIRYSVATALLLVFVDCVKELPATLLLRPFNFNTLATLAHEQASLEKIAEAAPPAMVIIALGLAAVLILARANLRRAP